ncbi:hypothetical protein MCEMSHM24_02416 [Comamonadaceae bacterium]
MPRTRKEDLAEGEPFDYYVPDVVFHTSAPVELRDYWVYLSKLQMFENRTVSDIFTLSVCHFLVSRPFDRSAFTFVQPEGFYSGAPKKDPVTGKLVREKNPGWVALHLPFAATIKDSAGNQVTAKQLKAEVDLVLTRLKSEGKIVTTGKDTGLSSFAYTVLCWATETLFPRELYQPALPPLKKLKLPAAMLSAAEANPEVKAPVPVSAKKSAAKPSKSKS